MLAASNGVLKLPLIKNKKTVNPRDSATPPVFQLETAMGSAIECFDDSGAVVVPRERFAPVKTTNDLFALRSDVYKVRTLAPASPEGIRQWSGRIAVVTELEEHRHAATAIAYKQTMCRRRCQCLHHYCE